MYTERQRISAMLLAIAPRFNITSTKVKFSVMSVRHSVHIGMFQVTITHDELNIERNCTGISLAPSAAPPSGTRGRTNGRVRGPHPTGMLIANRFHTSNELLQKIGYNSKLICSVSVVAALTLIFKCKRPLALTIHFRLHY